MTTLMVWDLWDDPVEVTELLQLWDDVHGAVGGSLGSGLPCDSRGHKQPKQQMEPQLQKTVGVANKKKVPPMEEVTTHSGVE